MASASSEGERAVLVLADEPIVAAVAPGDELAARSTIPLDALRDRALISLPPGTSIRSRLEEGCAAAGFRPPCRLRGR
ncbi:LysR substrate-binding domain-containing protein [Pseudonocardia sp.]|uniref:LysR substrate-binding domain-containing protein n=1 Tax=Pseudonocardia sp. TaxID=60912 RepID=UPI002F423663